MLKVISVTQNDDGTFDEPDGEIVEVLGANHPRFNKLRLLMRLDEDELEDAADEEMVVDPDEKTPICGDPKSNGEPCTREVGEPGELCWQHED